MEDEIQQLRQENIMLHEINDQHRKLNGELRKRIDKAIHRIQLLQMDGEVTIKDLVLIVRDLKGDSDE